MAHRFILFIVLFIQVVETLAQKDSDADVLYVTFNQPQYASGDTAFFKLNIPTNQKKQKRTLVNVALFKDGNQMLLQRTMVKDEVYSGYLNLTSNIVNGLYVLAIEINGVFYEGIFNVCAIGESGIFKTDSTFVSTDFSDRPYGMRENITVHVDLKEIIDGELAVSVIRDDLFVSQNVVACNRTGMKSNMVESFPDYFSGKVISTLGKKVPDSTMITFFLQKNDFIYPVYTRSNGEFRFPLFKNFGSDNVFYTISYRGIRMNNFSIVLDKIFQAPTLSVSEQVNDNQILYDDFVKKKDLIQKSYDFFLDQIKPTKDESSVDSFQGDMEVNLERFEKFQSMSEIIINILPAVKYRKNQKRESVRIFLQETAQIGAHDPLYIIDGVITDSTEIFLSLKPEKIKTIKILRSAEKLRRFGDLGKDGILVVESNVLEGMTIFPSSKSLNIIGINEATSFNNYGHVKRQLAPDVRSCLYWNPNLKLDSGGKASFTLNTGEITGPIRIILTGISKEGDFRYFESIGICEFRK